MIQDYYYYTKKSHNFSVNVPPLLPYDILMDYQSDETYRYIDTGFVLLESEFTVNYLCIKYPQYFWKS